MERDRSALNALLQLYHFNSHAHVERDRRVVFRLVCIWNFNSHAHVERDLIQALGFSGCIFQLTRSRGAWLLPVLDLPYSTTFQLTRSRGAWHSASVNNSTHLNFNSHAHVERDYLFYLLRPSPLNISTHTLTWSVTKSQDKMEGMLFISTHTLTWSVTREMLIDRISENDFNSHAHVERDQPAVSHWRTPAISTHTLTWSVTA